jgi:hypothetical protein
MEMRKVKLVCLLAFLPAIAFAQQNSTPCQSADQRAFDFWLGEWRVTTPDGKHAGDNTLTSIQGGCVMQENWRSATSPYTGTSFNFYNQNTKLWEQVWLDNQGGSLHMRGQRAGNTMVMRTDSSPNQDGKQSYNEIVWTKNEDGSVHQLWTLKTEGADDQVLFDGLYRKAE